CFELSGDVPVRQIQDSTQSRFQRISHLNTGFAPDGMERRSLPLFDFCCVLCLARIEAWCATLRSKSTADFDWAVGVQKIRIARYHRLATRVILKAKQRAQRNATEQRSIKSRRVNRL